MTQKWLTITLPLSQAKAARAAAEEQTTFEVTCESKWRTEVEGHREQVRQHARTICVMEERLARFAKELTVAQSEIVRLHNLHQLAGRRHFRLLCLNIYLMLIHNYVAYE